MKKLICLFTILAFLGVANSMAQGLHFGLKAGVLGNKANVSGMRNQFKEESLTGFQVGPMLQYQTGFHGIALDFSLLYVQRGVKLTNTSNGRSTDIRTQSIDIPIELKWEWGYQMILIYFWEQVLLSLFWWMRIIGDVNWLILL